MSEMLKELEALDYPEVLKGISSHATVSLAKNQIESARPLENYLDLQYELMLAREGVNFVREGKDLELHFLEGIDQTLEDARKGRVLTEEQLITVLFFLEDLTLTKKKFEGFENLNELAESIRTGGKLLQDLKSSLDEKGNILPYASSELKRLIDQSEDLKQMRSERARDFSRNHSEAIMDGIYTVWHDRLCFLIKANYKNSFKGLVHGSSQSGLAYYVEPESFVHLNNRYLDLQAQIEMEKERIRRALSLKIKKETNVLKPSLEALVEIDEALAKGKYAIANDGTIPEVSRKNRKINLKKVRHPLLDSKKVVSNDYQLKKKVLVISGPNMGGKSVSLKSVGLFCLLAHSGFPVLAEQAALPYFQSFYFDLQDNASIQENLSTFSAHVKKLVYILEHADENSLILLDEIGHGTAPEEGESLAQAVIEKLIDKDATILSTTHFESVKNFAELNNDIQIAAMEFDSEKLIPTYRFLPDVLSSSFAFDIARMFHMDEKILERAKQLQIDQHSDVQKEMDKLQKLQQETQRKQDLFEQRMQKLHEAQRNNDDLRKELEAQKIRMEEEYRTRLNELVEEKKREADELIRELRKQNKFQNYAIMNELDELNEEQEKEPEKKSFKKGDYVKVTSLNLHGEIIELTKKKATVLSNGKKLSVSIDSLDPMIRPVQKSVEKYEPRKFERFPLELNLIGMRVQEGLEQLDHYLDQAVLHNIKNVRIIHGMGSGKLRNAVWKDLKKTSSVKSFQAAGPNQGGLGATLVELK